jgi:hypothetical protein
LRFVDMMRSLYVWRKQADLPQSTRDVIHALISIGTPGSVLSSAQARATYDDIVEKKFMSEEVYQSPSEGEDDEEEETGSTGSVIEQKQEQPPQQIGKGVVRKVVSKPPGKLPEVLRLYSDC